MRVVIAPDSFKGTATAAEIARAIAEGWLAARPDDHVDLLPMADGGEGTLDAFAAAVPGAERIPIVVPGPDDRPVHTAWLRLPDGRAVVELASTSGITLLDPLRPETAHTTGFGRAIAAALGAGARGLVLGIGGSSSTDGGIGMLEALGLRVTTDGGDDAATGGARLDRVVGVDRTGLRPLPDRGVAVLTDVTSPLTGPEGAAAVFGPQKGVTPDRITAHDERLARWAGWFPDVDGSSPGAGAAGGTGFGLLVWGATLEPGAHAVAAALGLGRAIADADLVVTGEGRFDGQSEAGKVPTTVRGLAPAGRTLLVAGAIDAPTDDFGDAVALTDLAARRVGDPGDALRDPLRWAAEAGRALARRV